MQRLTLAEFREDLRRSLDVLRTYQDAVIGYRAPGFSMPYDEPHFDALRCNGRHRLFRSIIGCARFEPIESFLGDRLRAGPSG